MTFLQILNDSYRRLGINTSSVPTGDSDRIKAFANETQREILRIKHFGIFRRRIVQCACIANVPFMAMPRSAVRVWGIQDRTNDYFLEEKSLQWIRTYDPSLRAVTANPWAYALYDLASPVMRQPDITSPTQLKVVSSAAGDTTQTAFIEYVRGMTNFGPYFADSKLLNGITNVNFTNSDAVAVNKFYLSAVAVGNVSLLDGAGNTLAIIPIGQLFARYTLVHLYPTPSAAATYYADIEVHVEDMANNNDEPLVPEEFHGLMGIGIRKKEYEKRENWKAVKEMDEEFKQERSRMITWVHQQAGLRNPGDGRRRFSQLGAFYPPGT